jgi:hypothetical protein
MDDLEKIYKSYFSISNEEIFTHLTYTSNLLTKHNINHWIVYGTLLGAVRENNIIKHDYDFDLGILIEDYLKILQLNELISADGYEFSKQLGTVYNIPYIKKCESKWKVSLKVLFKDDPVGDIYFYYPCSDGFLRRYDPLEGTYFYPNSTIPKFFVEKLINLNINGLNFPSPQFPEILVEHFYGPHWKTPIRASSQDGENHPDYDFYGNYKFSSLNFLIKFVYNETKFELVPNIRKDFIKFIFPPEQTDWILHNENYKIAIKKN